MDNSKRLFASVGVVATGLNPTIPDPLASWVGLEPTPTAVEVEGGDWWSDPEVEALLRRG